MAATSHPIATTAAVSCLLQGGNAVDAAVTAAAVLTVCEPMSTGPGGDLFSLVWDDGKLTGLNASGRAPMGIDPDAIEAIGLHSPRAVTVPGSVSGWAALLERHGSIGLDRALAPAIDAAERGFALTPVIGSAWADAERDLAGNAEAAKAFLPVPRVGSIVRLPDLGATLRRIAAEGPDAFYRGPVARAIASASWLSVDDLAAHRADWVEPLRHRVAGVDVCEIPPNGQGVAALQALGILDGLGAGRAPTADRVHLQAEAMKLAFADAYAYVHEGPLPQGYLDPRYLAQRRSSIDPRRASSPRAGALPTGGTVYLCVVDSDRRACSLIQSVYHSFGSCIVAPGTGVVLQNRGAGFSLEPGHPNRIAPGKRPYHTIIPGMLLDGDSLVGPFGLMGGHMQPQGHTQLVHHLFERQLDPQPALDEPRWRLDLADDEWSLALEPGFWPVAEDLARRGHRVLLDADGRHFGGGQAILVRGDSLIGGSEPRKDGHAAGF